MAISLVFFILCLLSTFPELIIPINAQNFFACSYCNRSRGTYNSTSDYSKNLNTVLSMISSNTKIDNGFYSLSKGENSNKVYGIALCRADLTNSDCQSCLHDAANRLPTLSCPERKEAIGYYYGRCMVRYSDTPILGIKQLTPNCTLNSSNTVVSSDAKKFGEKLSILLDELRQTASSGGLRYKFATGSENVTASLQVYGLMQCNPDLTVSDCSDCLKAGTRQLKSCCSSLTGAGVYGPSCAVEFENYPFATVGYTISQPPISSSSTTNTSIRGKRWDTKKTLIIAGVLFVLLLALWLYLRRRRKFTEEATNKIQISCVDSLKFDSATIQAATNNFADGKRLGKDSATRVYKGMLPNEQEIAVKLVTKNDGFGDLEFNNEILLLADLQHRNLVKLLGFCLENDSRYLVYEYYPNESLDLYLQDGFKRANLNWETRYKIILGIARGLLYLHEDSQLRVIHRDLKPSNILLDAMMNPKISNFSKATLDQSDRAMGVRNTILGTYGYMPPEYVKQGLFSTKSDVFSFGILLLEIISGKLISSSFDKEQFDTLPNFVWKKWSEGKALEAVDETQMPTIQTHYAIEIMRCVKIALLCVQENPTCRPTMSNVLLMLNSDPVAITEPSRPAFLISSDMDHASSSYSSNQKSKLSESSANEVSITELVPR